MALGATPRGVLMLILRQGLAVTAVGVAVGLAGAFVVTRFMAGLLFGVSAIDPLTFVAVAAVLATAAFVASYAPGATRRARRSDGVAAG